MGRVSDPVQALRMLARLPTPAPSSMGYFYSPRIARTVRDWLARERYDLIFVHCSSVAQYVADMTAIPKILDFGDMDSQKWLEYARYKPFPLSIGYYLEGTKLRREEARLARHFDLCTTTTRAEWQTLESYHTGVATDWFPNGVDAEYFTPSPEPYDPDTLAFVGRMDYYPNQECMFDFCARTLPRLQATRPALKLSIVGADPSAAIRNLGEAARRHRHRFGAGRAAVPPSRGRDGRAAPDRPGNAEQDSRGDGRGRPGGHQPHRRGRRRCAPRRASAGRRRAAGIRRRSASRGRKSGRARAPRGRRKAADALAP